MLLQPGRAACLLLRLNGGQRLRQRLLLRRSQHTVDLLRQGARLLDAAGRSSLRALDGGGIVRVTRITSTVMP